jgi:hypothetical protein
MDQPEPYPTRILFQDPTVFYLQGQREKSERDLDLLRFALAASNQFVPTLLPAGHFVVAASL